jgi:hypothetical protein
LARIMGLKKWWLALPHCSVTYSWRWGCWCMMTGSFITKFECLLFSVIALVSIMHISFHERKIPRDFVYGPFFSLSRDFQDLIIYTSLASQVCGDWKLEPLFNWEWRSNGKIVRTSPTEILVCFVFDQNSQISIGMKPENGERLLYRLQGIFQPECWVSAKKSV